MAGILWPPLPVEDNIFGGRQHFFVVADSGPPTQSDQLLSYVPLDLVYFHQKVLALNPPNMPK
jgi:hypothetical protein